MTQVDLDNRIRAAAAPSVLPLVSGSGTAAGPAFSKVLQDQLTAQAASAGVKFSAHAQTRLSSRQIRLSGDDIDKLGAAITKAAQKGSRESLVLMDKAALVVSVPNRTVITAVDKTAMKENIFTNIDSAIIL
jgi:flagellar operon protein